MSKAFAGLKAVHELRFHLCQTSKHSEGARNFLLKSYEKLKAASPTTPVLIREAHGVEPKLFARYAIKEEEEEEIEEKGERNLTKNTTDGLTSFLTSILKFAHDEKQISDRKRASL